MVSSVLEDLRTVVVGGSGETASGSSTDAFRGDCTLLVGDVLDGDRVGDLVGDLTGETLDGDDLVLLVLVLDTVVVVLYFAVVVTSCCFC